MLLCPCAFECATLLIREKNEHTTGIQKKKISEISTQHMTDHSAQLLQQPLLQVLRENPTLIPEMVLIAFLQGLLAAWALFTIYLYSQDYYGIYHFAAATYILVCVVLFHMAEFLVAALFRPHDTHPRAFMLYHSPQFLIANVCAIIEFLVESYLVPDEWKLFQLSFSSTVIAAVLVVGFYAIRVVAMIQCADNFSLIIEAERRQEHVLVTTGLYKWLRHPAYFGWFWRTLCTQLIVMNPVCAVGFTVVTWYFFKVRIADEEAILLRGDYFAKEYKAYRARTPTGIPLIP